MTGAGRPLRFLLLVMASWVGLRAAMLWPASPAAAEQAGFRTPMVPQAAVTPPPPVAAPRRAYATGAGTAIGKRSTLPVVVAALERLPDTTTFTIDPSPPPGGMQQTASPGIVAGLPAALPHVPRAPPAPPASAARSRFFGSSWALARGGNGPAGGLAGPQLGGSQAGIRLAYALTRDRRLALAARASSPLGRGMREAALGIEWQPTRLPVRLVAEQRFALNEGRGGPTLAAVGGFGPLPLVAGFNAEAYAQGGVIWRGGAEGYADGALRVARPLVHLGKTRIDLGAGGWGAAQKGASRLDLGPSLSAAVPIGRQRVRLSLDWRQRVAGKASPGSGPVVTLGADF